jgi:hypothetical protein
MRLSVIFLTALFFLVAIVFVGCNFDESNAEIIEMPSVNSIATVDAEEIADLQEGEIVYLNDMNVEEISQYINGNVFQGNSYSIGSGLGEVICFIPESNEYFWFCSSMDAQSRIRAEYGTWILEDGFMTTTTLKLIEWIDGHFTTAYGSIGSRFELVDYNEVLTEVNIESQFNFRMFKFLYFTGNEGLGFYFMGNEYYPIGGIGGIEGLKEDYERYFSLFEN